ncbi:MAG TPA: hypothetical protein VK469_20145 [Candidatus Kapabacteria bacterium]|nr:hypothetical protein [Candidatus Kapabacteria bacterium]
MNDIQLILEDQMPVNFENAGSTGYEPLQNGNVKFFISRRFK